jgi:ATP-binding cassette subfamily F protein uup
MVTKLSHHNLHAASAKLHAVDDIFCMPGEESLLPVTPVEFTYENIVYTVPDPSAHGKRDAPPLTLLRGVTGVCRPRTMTALMGASGAGKTTLLKMLTKELEPDTGTVTHAQTLSGVMIDQQRKLLEPDATVRQILAEGGDWIDVRGVRKHVMAYLKDFLFDPGLVDTKVGILSGGERSRLLLAREFARTANLLVLDEPTNDLDLETLDLLQEVIADFDGTVLIVSHDRDFLDRTVTVTLGLDGSGKVDIVAGGYADWEAKRKQPVASRSAAARKDETPVPPPPPPARFTVKLSYKDQRDYEILPARITELEAAIAKGEALLNDPELYAKDPQRFATISAGVANARAEKDAAEERWLMLAEQVEG